MNYSTALIQMPLVHEPSGGPIRSPEESYNACIDLATLAQECFTVLSLSAKNQLLNRHMITLGIVDCALVHAREVFRPLITDGASACILCLNHPSGDPTPSRADVDMTRRIMDACAPVGITVHDHVVVGKGTVASFHALGLLDP